MRLYIWAITVIESNVIFGKCYNQTKSFKPDIKQILQKIVKVRVRKFDKTQPFKTESNEK